jgi:uncharacterized membrane protein YbhN (UPF0104 family)
MTLLQADKPLEPVEMLAPSELQDASDKPPKKATSRLKSLLKVVISVGLLAFLLHYTGIEDTFTRLSQANLWYVPVGVAFYLFAQLISAYRWQFLAAALDFRLSLREMYDYYLIGMFFNMFLPGAIGGDAVRMFYLARRCNRKKRESLLTLLAERGVGLIALMLLTTLVCLTPELMAMNLAIPLKLPVVGSLMLDVRLILLGMSLCMLTGYALLWVLPLETLANQFSPVSLIVQAKVYWAKFGLLARSVAISLFVHGMMVAMHLLIAAALGVHVPVLYMAVVYGVVSLASVLPIAANGFGVREGIYWLFLTKIGFSKDTALAFALYWDAISILTSLLGGLILLKGHYRKPDLQEVAVTEV